MRQGVFTALGIQTGPFADNWAHFVPEAEEIQFFHLHTGRPILITPEELIMGKRDSSNFKIQWEKGFLVPWHWSWTIYSPLSPLYYRRISFFFFLFHTGRPIFITPEGIHPTSKVEWDRGFSVPGAFKLDHLQPIEPILFQKIFNFFTFILGGQFLLPQRANNGNGAFIHFSTRELKARWQFWPPKTPYIPKTRL